MTTSDETPDEIKIVRLNYVGSKLLKLLRGPSSVDQLLRLLDKLEVVLTTVEQSPTESVREALLPSMMALISAELLRHSNEGVKISVTSCIAEITRISAPDSPYNDEQMKEIFRLAVAAFEKLSHVSGRCYKKAVSIIDNVAKVKTCLVMLDLECYDLVIEMFQHFLRVIRSNHPPIVMHSMESIMTMVLDESEEISLDLLRPLIDSVRKENQTISPVAWTLGEKVITNCAVKLKPYLMKAVESTGRALDEYGQILTSICQNGSESPQHDHSNGSKILVQVQAVENKLDVRKDADEQPCDVTKGLDLDMTCARVVAQIMDDTKSNIGSSSASTMGSEIIKKDGSKRQPHSDLTKKSKSSNAKTNSETGNLESVRELKTETELDTEPKKRGCKPKSLMNPEEGYDRFWISMGRKTTKRTKNRKACDSGTDFPPSENPTSRKDKFLSKPENVSEALVSQPKTDETTDAAPPSKSSSIPDGNHPKRGRPRKRSSSGNQDVDPNTVSMSKENNLNPLLEVTSLEPTCDRLKKESELRKDSEVKPRVFKLKIKGPAKIVEKTAIAPESVVAKMESKTSCKDEGKPKSAMNVEVPNREEELITESASKTLHRFGEAPQTRQRRRRTTTASEMHKYDGSLVGNSIKVWWPMDKMFYEGVIDSYDPVKGKHKIVYADGDVEVLNLKKQRWKIISDDVSPDKEQGTGLQKLAEASDIVQKCKAKSESKPAKSASVNSRSRGRASASISGKPVHTEAVERPDLAYEFMEDPLATKRMKTGTRD